MHFNSWQWQIRGQLQNNSVNGAMLITIQPSDSDNDSTTTEYIKHLLITGFDGNAKKCCVCYKNL